jgi:endonuclease/exonuclease/phosphatase family metal-dependent hydrolase
MTTVRIASYNIHGCVGADRKRDPARIGAVLAELHADVIALQEVDSRDESTAVESQWQSLAARVGLRAVPGPTLVEREGQYGNAVLTRAPVLESLQHNLSVPGREPRGAVEVVVDVPGVALRVIVAHLGLSAAERRRQVRQLLGIIGARSELPLVLAGDFNEWWPWGRPLRWLSRALGCAAAPRSYPAKLPMLPLDRVWVRPERLLQDVSPHRSRLARIASDHLPVVATVDLSCLVASP